MSQATVLVVDDDKEIVGAIARLLEMEGHRVLKAYDGLQALETLTEEHVDLIILDVMMPNMDGMSATMAIRRRQNLPILLLSAKSEEADKNGGLGIGAGGYLTKPYNPMELSARVNALLRRYLRLGAADNTAPSEEQLVNGGICMNLARKEVLVEGELVRLTPTEYRMLEFFMQHPNRVYSAAQIYEQVWNEPSCGVENTVMVHIRHLREKIEINPKKPNYIKVVWGLGYKMEQKK